MNTNVREAGWSLHSSGEPSDARELITESTDLARIEDDYRSCSTLRPRVLRYYRSTKSFWDVSAILFTAFEQQLCVGDVITCRDTVTCEV